jgi:hypothetical protein
MGKREREMGKREREMERKINKDFSVDSIFRTPPISLVSVAGSMPWILQFDREVVFIIYN